MALIQCTECGQRVSDRAGSCPKCGAPVGYAAQQRGVAPPPLPYAAPQQGVTPPAFSPYVAPQSSYAPQKPDNLLVWSILATVLCCLPGGIVAIVYSNKVNSLWATGDYAGARNAANSAKTWCWVSFGVGLLFFIIYGIAAAADAL